MRTRINKLLSTVTGLLLALALSQVAMLPVHAQDPSPDQIEEWNKLTPEQKENLRKRNQAFKALTPEQQREIRDNLEHFRKLNREERRLVLENYSAFQRLSPNERNLLHRNF